MIGDTVPFLLLVTGPVPWVSACPGSGGSRRQQCPASELGGGPQGQAELGALTQLPFLQPSSAPDVLRAESQGCFSVCWLSNPVTQPVCKALWCQRSQWREGLALGGLFPPCHSCPRQPGVGAEHSASPSHAPEPSLWR